MLVCMFRAANCSRRQRRTACEVSGGARTAGTARPSGMAHRELSTEDRNSSPRLDAEQAGLMLEAIRAEADVQSSIRDAKWSKEETGRVRLLFGSERTIRTLQRRVACDAPGDEKLQLWCAWHIHRVRVDGSTTSRDERVKLLLKSLRRRWNEEARREAVPRARASDEGTASQILVATPVAGETDPAQARRRRVLQTAMTVLWAERSLRLGLRTSALRAPRPAGRVMSAPSNDGRSDHTLLETERRVLVFRESVSRQVTIRPLGPVRTSCAKGPRVTATPREVCARASRKGPSVSDSLPSWVRHDKQLREAVSGHGGWAVTTMEALRQWARNGGRVSPAHLLSSKTVPTIVRATSGRIAVLELSDDEEDEVGPLLLLNLMGAEEAAFAMGWEAMPELLDCIRCEARRSEGTAWQVVGDSVEYRSARWVCEIALQRLGAVAHLETLEMIEFNAGVGVMASVFAQLDSRVRLCAACECWEVPRRILYRLHGDDLPVYTWSHTEATAMQLLAQVPHPAICHFSWECKPYAGRNREGTPTSEQRAPKVEANLAELASVIECWRELCPLVITVENVASLVTTFVWAEVWERAYKMLTTLPGYEWEYQVIRPEEDVMASCARTRLFIWGWRRPTGGAAGAEEGTTEGGSCGVATATGGAMPNESAGGMQELEGARPSGRTRAARARAATPYGR